MASTSVPTPVQEKPPRRVRRLVNYRVLIALLALGGVLAAGAYFLHGFQVKRNASALLQQADRAEEEGDAAKAVAYLARYLELRPQDAEAAARYALLREPLAVTPRAREQVFLALERALRLDPSRRDVRRRGAQVALKLGRYGDARAHLNALLKPPPGDAGEQGELEYLLGQTEEQDGKYAQAKAAYQQAVKDKPDNIDAWEAYAALLRRRLQDEEGARQAIDDMMEKNPRPPSADKAKKVRVSSYASVGTTKALRDARKDLADILERLAEQDPEVLLLAGDLELAGGDPAQARKYLERGLRLHPKEARYYQGLARLDLREGKRAAALERLRQGLEHLPEQGDPVWEHLNLFIDAGAASDAEKLLAQINPEALPPALHDYLQGRLRLQEKKWAAAVELLSRSRQELTRLPDLLKQANLYLAEAHQHLGNPDQQLAACDAALKTDPLWEPALLAAAQAHVALGQRDQALAVYEGLVEREPQARLEAARLLIEGGLKLSRQERLQKAAELLAGAPKAVKEGRDYRLLHLDLLAGRGDLAKARLEAEELRKKDSKELEPWLALIRLAALEKKPREMGSLLEQARVALGPRPELAVLRLQYLRGSARGEEARKLREELASQVDKRPAEERAAWLRALADDALAQGDGATAERLLSRLAEKDPQDINVRVLLFDLALTRGDRAAVQAALERLRALEGPEGTYWRYGEAVQILTEARSPDAETLARARTLLTEASERRGSWGRVLVAEGRLAEMEGNADRAIEKYAAAIERGERGLDVVRRLVVLLNSQRRYTDAQEIITRIQKETPPSSLLKKLAAETSLASQAKAEDTLKLAEEAVEKDSASYRDYLWLGQVLWSLEKERRAGNAFEKAVELGPDRPEAWVYLVHFLARTDQGKQAKQAIEKAKKKLSGDEKPLALAACYEVLGERKRAEEYYQDALKARRNDLGILRLLAEHHLRAGELAQAEPYLRQIMDSDRRGSERVVLWARRTLALALLGSGGYQNSQKALSLLEENLRSRYSSPADERAKALVLAQRPNGRRDAIRTLEASFGRMPANADEQLLLAQLYEAEGDWARARERLRELVTRQTKNTTYLTHYVRGLLQNKDEDEVEVWLGKLEALEEENKTRTLPTVGLRAQLLREQGKTDEAVKLLKDFANTEPKNRGRQLGVGRLLDHIGRPKDAEPIYRANINAHGGKHLEDILPLVMNLARQDRLREALDLCEDLHGKIPDPVLAELCINALRGTKPSDRDCERVEKWLEADMKKPGSSPVLALGLANVRDLQGKQDEAEKIYRDVLKDNPRNVIARNNLAMLLAVREGNGGEALEQVEQALEEVGHQAYLLDTRGLVYLSMNQPDLAARDLEEATSIQPNPAGFYRLARAYDMLGDRQAAASAFRKAQTQNGGLRVTDLHPLERPDYEKMARKYGKDQEK